VHLNGKGGMMQGLHHVSLTVASLEDSPRFYRDVLGLEVEIQPTGWSEGKDLARALGVESPAALRLTILKVGSSGSRLELLQFREPASRSARALPPSDVGAAHLCFQVDDVRATCAALTAQGVCFLAPVSVIADGPLAGWNWVYFKDPDGHTLELVQVGRQRRA
jgi:glyoxylase I family protein